jgi:hypothetical protein
MRRINAGVEIFADPTSLIFTLPIINDNSHTNLHTHAGDFSKVAEDTQQQANGDNRPVYQKLTMHENSPERHFLILQLGNPIPEKYLTSIHDLPVLNDLED